MAGVASTVLLMSWQQPRQLRNKVNKIATLLWRRWVPCLQAEAAVVVAVVVVVGVEEEEVRNEKDKITCNNKHMAAKEDPASSSARGKRARVL